jgi:holo-[acyl-carrier protein] synthase
MVLPAATMAAALQRGLCGSLLGASSTVVAGVGVDIAHTPRVLRLYQRYGDRFLRKVYHPTERAEFQRRVARCEGRGAEFLASRWSAKEAAYKALGRGAAVAALAKGKHGGDHDRDDSQQQQPRRPEFPELVVHGDGEGGASLVLHGAARRLADEAGVTDTHLSLSHEEDYAVAVVVTLAAAPENA